MPHNFHRIDYQEISIGNETKRNEKKRRMVNPKIDQKIYINFVLLFLILVVLVRIENSFAHFIFLVYSFNHFTLYLSFLLHSLKSQLVMKIHSILESFLPYFFFACLLARCTSSSSFSFQLLLMSLLPFLFFVLLLLLLLF